MKKPLILLSFIALCGLGACTQSKDAATSGIDLPPAPPGAPPDMDQPERPRDVRPRPASSGIGSDPNNPNGAPGPSTGLGTSSSRY